MSAPDPLHLDRFVAAQAGVWEQARAELRGGRKRTHWMWFIFPQIAGLGASATAVRYAIASRAEAEAYLAHTVLGPRLRELTGIVVGLGKPVEQIFGYPDDLKFHSSVTLFHEAAEDGSIFAEALQKCFNGRKDTATLDRLR